MAFAPASRIDFAVPASHALYSSSGAPLTWSAANRAAFSTWFISPSFCCGNERPSRSGRNSWITHRAPFYGTPASVGPDTRRTGDLHLQNDLDEIGARRRQALGKAAVEPLHRRRLATSTRVRPQRIDSALGIHAASGMCRVANFSKATPS